MNFIGIFIGILIGILTRTHMDSQGFTRMHKNSQGFTRIHKDSQGFTRSPVGPTGPGVQAPGGTNGTGGPDGDFH